MGPGIFKVGSRSRMHAVLPVVYSHIGAQEPWIRCLLQEQSLIQTIKFVSSFSSIGACTYQHARMHATMLQRKDIARS